jgi:hypothetical protein
MDAAKCNFALPAVVSAGTCWQWVGPREWYIPLATEKLILTLVAAKKKNITKILFIFFGLLRNEYLKSDRPSEG